MRLSEFKCPQCEGTHFGRVTTRMADGRVGVTSVVQCHDEHGVGCRWHGDWIESDALAEAAEIIREYSGVVYGSRTLELAAKARDWLAKHGGK